MVGFYVSWHSHGRPFLSTNIASGQLALAATNVTFCHHRLDLSIKFIKLNTDFGVIKCQAGITGFFMLK